jgi:hypothetical protein
MRKRRTFYLSYDNYQMDKDIMILIKLTLLSEFMFFPLEPLGILV